MTQTALNVDRIVTLNCGLGRDSIAMTGLLEEGELVVAERVWCCRDCGAEIPMVEELAPICDCTDPDGWCVPAMIQLTTKIGRQDVDYVVFSDVGHEWEHTYKLIPTIREKCAAMGVRFFVLAKGNGRSYPAKPSTWAEVEAKAAAGGYHVSNKGQALPALMDEMLSRSTVVNFRGQCTDKHKISPMRRLIEDVARIRFGVRDNRRWGHEVRKGQRRPHLAMVGIAADETPRINKAAQAAGVSYVDETYPLVTMGIAKTDEQPILERHGLGHVRKSGCYLCPFQPASWYWALSVTDEVAYQMVVSYEAQALQNNPNMHATAAKKTIPEMVKTWRAANPKATVGAVLAKTYEMCPAAARTAQRVAA